MPSSPVLPIIPYPPAVEERGDEAGMVLLGYPEEVGDDQHGEGAGEVADELASPRARKVSSWRSASRHMNSSFPLSRLGVINRMSRAR